MDFSELSQFLDPVGEAVIGIADGKVAFANRSASDELGHDIIGRTEESLFAEEIVKNHSAFFAFTANVLSRPASVTVSHSGALTLYYISFDKNVDSMTVTPRMMNYLRSCANGLKLSADRCFAEFDKGQMPQEKHISVLYHYYYCITRMITQIDNADKLEHGEFTLMTAPVDLVKLCFELTDTVSGLCAGKDISVKFVCSEPSITAVVDQANIELMLLNLFSNSLKYTPAGGSVTLTLEKQEDSVMLSLDDTGEGIPKDKLAKLFRINGEEFDMAKPEPGLGLGIYISGSIVKLHRGVMLIESREGAGTHVRIKLPLDGKTTVRFNAPSVKYRSRGISPALTELSDVLKSDSYGPKFED